MDLDEHPLSNLVRSLAATEDSARNFEDPGLVSFDELAKRYLAAGL